MLALESPFWSELLHAYGAATDTPALLSHSLVSRARRPTKTNHGLLCGARSAIKATSTLRLLQQSPTSFRL